MCQLGLFDQNPLSDPQRETKGAETFAKFEYQYHWALCKIIEQHQSNSEFVLFMEYHEDVVLASNTNRDTATFEFNQVKDYNSAVSLNELISKPKKSNNSIIGKMITSVKEKSFKDRIDSLNLVASSGFKFAPRIKGVKLEVIRVGDLSDSDLSVLTEAIFNEVGLKEPPQKLKFVIPNLHNKNFQSATIGNIASLIDKKYPRTLCNAPEIYRILLDDLHRKGQIEFQYEEWTDLIKRKGLTHEQVKSTIDSHSSNNQDQFINDFNGIVSDLPITGIDKSRLRHSFLNYLRSHDNSSYSISVKGKLRSLVCDFLEKTPEINELIISVEKSCDTELLQSMASHLHLKAAIIYHIIEAIHEQSKV